MVRQRLLSEILEPRARELFHLLRENLRQGGVLEAMGAGCVVTGGGSRLPGLLDVAESLLRVPARIGYPVPLSKMPEELVQPEFAATSWHAVVYPPHPHLACGGRSGSASKVTSDVCWKFVKSN